MGHADLERTGGGVWMDDGMAARVSSPSRHYHCCNHDDSHSHSHSHSCEDDGGRRRWRRRRLDYLRQAKTRDTFAPGDTSGPPACKRALPKTIGRAPRAPSARPLQSIAPPRPQTVSFASVKRRLRFRRPLHHCVRCHRLLHRPDPLRRHLSPRVAAGAAQPRSSGGPSWSGSGL